MVICGFLASHGIEARYDTGDLVQPLSGLGGIAGEGAERQEILVAAEDADRARELLEQLPS